MNARHPIFISALLAGASAALGQSAKNFAPPAEAAESGEQADAPAPAPKVNPDLIQQPSRHLGLDVDPYLTALLASFDMNDRDYGPFGKHQDPNFQPPKPKVAPKSVPKFNPEPITPFVDIVAAIPVTTIISGQDKFLIGGRSFTVGDTLKLRTGIEQTTPAIVTAVDADRVTFRHGETDETAALSLRLMPSGMQPGSAEIQPAGVTPVGSEAPIELPAIGSNALSSRP
jgi:hypothetical protein